MDDRILASAPECYITTFDKLLRSIGPQDAEQILTYSLEKGFDLSDLIEIRAPKPTLMVTTTQDIFSIQGARDVFREAQNAYIAFGAPENLNMVEDDAGHTSTKKNREATNAFFQKFLHNPGDPKDETIEFFDEKDLLVTPTGQVLTSLKGETLFSLNEKYTAEVVGKLQTEKQSNPDFYSELAQKAKSLSGYTGPTLSNDVIFSGRLWRDGYAIEKYLIKGAYNYYIPVLRLASVQNNGKTILLLDDQGKTSAAATGGLAEQLALKGYQIILPDLSGFGELNSRFKDGDATIRDVPLNIWYAGILTHKSPLAIRIEEIKIVVDFIKNTPFSLGEGTEVGYFSSEERTEVRCISLGTLSSDLLHASLINNDFSQIALINPLISYQSIVQERDYQPKFAMSALPGVLGYYDLPDLITALSPLKICVLNPVNALDQMVDNSVCEQTYKDSTSRNRGSQNFTIHCKESDVFSKLLQWLE
jgi:hypothetical protein